MLADGALSVEGAAALAKPMQSWLNALEPETTAGILFTFDTHFEETYYSMPESKEFPIHCVRGTKGWENRLSWSGIDADIPVWRIEKGVFNMWEEAGLKMEAVHGGDTVDREAFFESLKADGINHVTVIGVAADYCVKWAVEGLVARGFAVTIPKDLTKGIHRQIEQIAAEDFAGQQVALA